MFYDIALVYVPEDRACDLALGEDGDLLIDETPITPMLTSVGLDRRAAPDDDLPQGRSNFLAPASFSDRRGSAGDGLDPFGELTGSRIWLLDRAKRTETTRQMMAFWLSEALAWAAKETGKPAEVEVEWRDGNVLAWRVMVEDVSLTLTQKLEA